MKYKPKKNSKTMLSEKIADALTVKPRADIEDDQVFGTKPKTLSRADFSSSESENETAISDFRKRNVNLLSEISKKYEGQVVSRKDLESNESSETDDSDHSGEDDVTTKGKEQPVVDVSLQGKSNKALSDSEDLESDHEISVESKHSISEDDESDDYSIKKLQESQSGDLSDDEASGSNDDDDDGDDDDDDNASGDEDNDDEGYDISQMSEPMKEEFKHVKKSNISEEAKKGACVRNQLLIWEGLLEMRIHLQRCMNTANQMPMPDCFEKLKESKEFDEATNATKTNVANVLDKFITLQSVLYKKFPETKALSLNKQELQSKVESKQDDNEEIPSDTDNEEIPSDTDAEDETESLNKHEESAKKISKPLPKKRKLEDYEKEIATSHKSFKTFRDTTIQKWNEKTRLATAANMKNQPTNTILQQISYILSDKEKLLRRTQLKRSEYDIVGYNRPIAPENKDENETNLVIKNRKDDDEYIPEIFDDSDFYHQLLRELIECKSADISDPVQLSRQWIALQQMRSKMKRKVDTKATKGRKIKYVVHNQLINYMAPEKCTSWTEDSANELYSSLFGKMFESNNVGLSGNVANGFKIKN